MRREREHERKKKKIETVEEECVSERDGEVITQNKNKKISNKKTK